MLVRGEIERGSLLLASRTTVVLSPQFTKVDTMTTSRLDTNATSCLYRGGVRQDHVACSHS